MDGNAKRRHLAVIPARGGSKRLPRKNIVDFLGRPIIAHTIAAARAAGIFDRVLVSTEDTEIAEIARRYGGLVDNRPAALGGDTVGIAEVCRELISRLAEMGDTFDTLSVLYATAPLRTAVDITDTWTLLEPGVCDYAMAVTAFSQPVHQALTIGEDRAMRPQFPDLVTRRQDTVPEFYAGNGSTYCVDLQAFLATGAFYGPGLRGHIMPASRSVDIDSIDDYELALFRAGQAHDLG